MTLQVASSWRDATPIISIVWSYQREIRAQWILRNSIKLITWGSMAERKIRVVPFLWTFASIKLSVAVTANPAENSTSHSLGVHHIETQESPYVPVYPISKNPFMSTSIGRLPILHPPGYGSSTEPKACKKPGTSNILARILLASSRSILWLCIAVVSMERVFSWKLTCTHALFAMARRVCTSLISGTLWMVAFLNSRAAPIRGRAAFLDPLICTVPESLCPQIILSIHMTQ